MEQIEYTIKIIMSPHHWDNEEVPYFWAINYWDGEAGAWFNKLNGWAKTPNEAWEIANKEYIKIIAM